MVGGRLFLNTPTSVGAAIDARTGETIWLYNPKSYEKGTTTMSARWNQRGVAYWTDGKERRIFWGTGDGFLVAVDATPATRWRALATGAVLISCRRFRRLPAAPATGSTR